MRSRPASTRSPGAPTPSRRSRAAACLLPVLAVACGKAPENAAVAPPAPAAVAEAQIEAEVAQALAERPAPEAPRASGLETQAEDILAKYPGKNAVELLNVPEVNASLKVALQKLGQNKALQNRINGTVELAAKMQGLSGEPGTARLDLDLSKYDAPRKSRLLQAVLSEEPGRIVGFLVEEIGEAAPELSYGGAERARNGIAIREQTPPPKPPADSPPD